MDKNGPIINRIELFNIYKGFADTYDQENPQIVNKIFHTLRVANNCDVISDSLGLTGLNKEIAWAIGMLHDVARFGQALKSNSFRDGVIDHAKDGAKLLFDLGMIEDYIPRYNDLSKEDLECMKKAIYYHNAFELPKNLTEKEALFCKIIRDADKIDIIRMCFSDDFNVVFGNTREEISSSSFSEIVLDYIFTKSTVKLTDCVTPGDFFLAKIALVFGLYFARSKMLMFGQGYIDRFFNAVKLNSPSRQATLMNIKDFVTDYLTH